MQEEKFINQLREGARSAYSQLLDDYEHKVFATCMSFVPNKEDAEDIGQEVFVEVFKSIQKFKGNSKLSTWIYRITTNKCLEFIRKRNTKKRRPRQRSDTRKPCSLARQGSESRRGGCT